MSSGEQVQPRTAAEAAPPIAGQSDVGLHRGSLSDLRVFGQSLAGAGPTLGAVAIIPLAYAEAGAGGWLTVLIGTLGILAVGGSITFMARRHATAGGLYNLNALGLGRWAGFLTAVALIALVTLIVPFGMIGFAQAVADFASSTGIAHFSPLAVFLFELVCVAGSAALAYLDIRLSTSVFLVIEAISMIMIVALLIVVLAHSPRLFDHAQLTLHGASLHGVLVGVAIMSLVFVGFEGSTSLGLEARRPARALPLALLGAVAVVGIFDTINAYVQTLGFSNLRLSLVGQSAPLAVLAQHYHVGALGDAVLLGVASSFLAAVITWMVYGPRVLLAMAHERVLPRAFARTGQRHGSPIVGVTAWLVAGIVVAVWIYVAGYSQNNAYGYFGTFTGLCATLYYLLVGAAVIVWAYRRLELNLTIVAVGVCAIAIMGIAFYFTFVPLPAYPMRGYLWAFIGLTAAGIVGYAALRRLAPDRAARIGTTHEDIITGIVAVEIADPEVSVRLPEVPA